MIVLGYLEKVEGDRRVRNAVVIYDRGDPIGRHYKHNLWVDARRPYRDEPSLMIPGKEIEVFQTRWGVSAILICYENMFAGQLGRAAGQGGLRAKPVQLPGRPVREQHPQRQAAGDPVGLGRSHGDGVLRRWLHDEPGDGRDRGCQRQGHRPLPVGAEVIAVGEIQIGKPK